MRTATLLGGMLDGVVLLRARQELLSAAAGRHVLNANMNAFPDDAVAHLQRPHQLLDIRLAQGFLDPFMTSEQQIHIHPRRSARLPGTESALRTALTGCRF